MAHTHREHRYTPNESYELWRNAAPIHRGRILMSLVKLSGVHADVEESAEHNAGHPDVDAVRGDAAIQRRLCIAAADVLERVLEVGPGPNLPADDVDDADAAADIDARFERIGVLLEKLEALHPSQPQPEGPSEGVLNRLMILVHQHMRGAEYREAMVWLKQVRPKAEKTP